LAKRREFAPTQSFPLRSLRVNDPVDPFGRIDPLSAEKGDPVSFASEFKEFAMKGSVIDLAVGVVIGAAFGKIVASLVGDVIMPGLSPALGSVNFTDLAVRVSTDAAGKPVMLKYGAFLQTIFEFIVIALSIFIVIKGINKLKRPPPPKVDASPPPPTKTEELLQEIRDLLARK
jgi:large conductance mechanosensitive channel